MDKETKQFIGCSAIIGIGLLIWIGIRANGAPLAQPKAWVQFLAIGGTLIVSGFLFIAGIAGLMADGAGAKFIGFVLFAISILGYVSVGMFLFTGNYARAIRVQQPWNWGKPYETQVAEVAEVEPTEAPTATARPEPTKTPKPTFTPVAEEAEAGEITVPSGGAQSFGQITQNLNEIWMLSPSQASTAATRLRAESSQKTGEELLAAQLLTAVAHERAGEMGAAQDAYNGLIDNVADTPYAGTAQYQLTMMEVKEEGSANVKDRIKKLREIFNKPGVEGWYLSGDNWDYTVSRKAAAEELVNLQSDYLSFRFFNWIYEKSTFPKEYSYLFIFLAILIAARLVTLPLSYRGQQMGVQLRKLQPRIDRINTLWADDAMEKNKRLMELYQDSGINYWNGCVIGLVDLVLVMWVFLTVRSFAPQFYLDGARLWVADDITVFNLQIILVWIGVMILQGFITYLSQPKTATVLQVGCGTILIFGIVAAVAYYFKTPVYGFILYALLAISTLLVTLILLPIALLTSRD